MKERLKYPILQIRDFRADSSQQAALPLYVEVVYYLWSILVQSSFSLGFFGIRHVIARTFAGFRLITRLHYETRHFQSHSLSTAISQRGKKENDNI